MSLWGLTNLWLWGQGWFIHESNLLCVKIKCVSNPWFWSSDHWILILLHTFSKREPKIGGLQHWLLISLVSTWYMGFRVQSCISWDKHPNLTTYHQAYQTLLYRMTESATTGSPSWLRCHVHIACVRFFMSNSPWPKLASLYAE
jgi:hypothetical protein